MAETRQTTVRFGNDLHQRLIHAARGSGLPINSLVIVACMEWLERHYPRSETGTPKMSNRLLQKVTAPFSRAQYRACSFCGKEQREFQRLVLGPGVAICDECVTLCNEIIAEEASPDDASPGRCR